MSNDELERVMKASIAPLKGKYYGTVVEIEGDGFETSVKVWVGSGRPSERELEECGLTVKDWDENTPIDDGWGGKVGCRSEVVCDSHYESEHSLNIAKRICDALND